MKKLAFFILLSLVTLGVSAQSNLKWNVNAGIGMSNWYGDDTDGTDAKFAYKVGIGLEVPFANTNIWSFQTGLNVSIRPRACFSPRYNKVKSQTCFVWLLTLL